MTQKNEQASGSPVKSGKSRRNVSDRTFSDMMEIPSFREYVADRHENDFQPHDSRLANRTSRARIQAILDVLDQV